MSSITIVACPKCGALVLGDAPHCHVCNHVLDKTTESAQLDARASLPTDAAVADDLEVCASCGETYRTGLVRCWNCGAFTRKEIEAAYQRLLSAPRENTPKHVELQELSHTTSQSQTVDDWLPHVAAAASAHGGEDDFELSAGDEDFEFELADSIQMTDSPDAPPAADAGGYALKTPAPHSPAPVAVAPPSETEAPPPAPATPAAEPEAAAPAERTAPPPDATPHSEATAGDVLLEIAKAEEKDVEKSKKTYREKMRGGFIVYCPMGCRIRVQDRHRGKAGKCPRCGAVFFVPLSRPKPKAAADAEAAAAQPADASVAGKWRGWMNDVHLHTVVPQKLRIKADSLLNDFTTVDAALSDEGLLLITLVASAGLFGANEKKKPALRAAVQEHLKNVGKVEGLPGAGAKLYPPDALRQLQVAQPSPPDVESLFGNIPVFGAARIAVRLPKLTEEPSTQYLSFTLSEFRDFVGQLTTMVGIEGLGANTEVPLSETYNTLKCHYSEAPVRELLGLEYYQRDGKIPLTLTGWRCGGCGLVVSEEARRKEKIGGLNGKGIAKAKCPKCAAKFGSHPLYEVAQPAAPAASAAPAAEPTTPAS